MHTAPNNSHQSAGMLIRTKIVHCMSVLYVTAVFDEGMVCLSCDCTRALNAYDWSLTSHVASLLWQTGLSACVQSTWQIECWRQGSFC